ncbi:hypothetical protein [Okeania sp. SIO2B3]|nr:hypothetical protein [Okeania sp. SIO2B3]
MIFEYTAEGRRKKEEGRRKNLTDKGEKKFSRSASILFFSSRGNW